MCEDDQGNLYASEYSDDVAPTLNIKAYKSTDNGANWSDISSGFPLTVNRHGHGVYWDPYRKLLFYTHGDGGATSDILYSSDRGSTWTRWTASIQATGMCFTPSYIFYGADPSGDRGIYRAVQAGDTPENVLVETNNNVGNIWAPFVKDTNLLVMPMYGGASNPTEWHVSTNDGETWENIAVLPVADDYFADRRYAGVSYYLDPSPDMYYRFNSTSELYAMRFSC
jgi:hypothetical protein